MPQPIDLQTELARITSVERIQQIADRASLAAQQRLTVSAQDERIAVETQVQQTQSKSEEVEQETRRRNPYRGRRGRSGKSVAASAHTKTGAASDGETHQLDVTI